MTTRVVYRCVRTVGVPRFHDACTHVLGASRLWRTFIFRMKRTRSFPFKLLYWIGRDKWIHFLHSGESDLNVPPYLCNFPALQDDAKEFTVKISWNPPAHIVGMTTACTPVSWAVISNIRDILFTETRNTRLHFSLLKTWMTLVLIGRFRLTWQHLLLKSRGGLWAPQEVEPSHFQIM